MNRMSSEEACTRMLMQYEQALIASMHLTNEYVELIKVYNEMLNKTDTLKEVV